MFIKRIYIIFRYISNTACKYKIWYVGKCRSNGTEIVHLILSKGGLNCTVAKQILQECDYVVSKPNNIQIPANAPFKDYLMNGEHTKNSLDTMLKNAV